MGQGLVLAIINRMLSGHWVRPRWRTTHLDFDMPGSGAKMHPVWVM